MSIPQVPEQARRAPILALRAVFAGIGRILLSADRAGAGSAGAVPAGAQPAGAQAAAAALDQQRQAAERRRSLDHTGNVRLLPAAEKVGPADAPAVAASTAVVYAMGEQAASTPALPLANYDVLSLASIRARLRGLDVSQLKVLLDYEAANAERPEVLGMFERRIEKLESGR
ncbi:MAG TPA: hypothetical protein VK836_22590 [Streptosporangiaceae bacterium]|nr:hypothetical protein [Streptosporangiaceae bacterium]